MNFVGNTRVPSRFLEVFDRPVPTSGEPMGVGLFAAEKQENDTVLRAGLKGQTRDNGRGWPAGASGYAEEDRQDMLQVRRSTQ